MNDEQIVIGSESNVIYYNLNKQFCNVKKVIVTKDEILRSFESSRMASLLEEMSSLEDENFNYGEYLNSKSFDEIIDEEISNDLYKKVQDALSSLHNDLAEIKLKDYNFMNSVSNTKFTVSIRCELFSISKHFIEKGAIISAFRSLLKEYVKCESNSFRHKRIENFQFEIIESEEVYKTIILKKEKDSLVLTSSFGYSMVEPYDILISPEIYFSKSDEFHMYKNNQYRAYLRDHSKIELKEINNQDKILSNDDLVLINENTKNINDAIVEMYINKKGKLRIFNIKLLENGIFNGFENGFILNKSSRNYNRISVTGLRENESEEMPNPRYLLIKNQEEVEEFLSDLSKLKNYDGVIMTTNFYDPFVDKIVSKLDMDFVITNESLSSSLDLSIDLNEFKFEGASQQVNANPFSNILKEETRERDELLEKLKNIDLSTPKEDFSQQNNSNERREDSAIRSIAEGIISSPNASTANQSRPNSMGWPQTNPSVSSLSPSGERKSAIGALADAVLSNNNTRPVEEEQVSQSTNEYYETDESIMPPEEIDFKESSFIEKNLSANDLNPLSSESVRQLSEVVNPLSENLPHNEIKIMTKPGISSGCYFVDSNTISEITDGEIFYVALDPDEMGNPHINYVLPIPLSNENTRDCFLLINSPNDYFLAKDNGRKYFVNLAQMDRSLTENFLGECVKRFGRISVIIKKEDIDLLLKIKDNVDNVFVKDLENDDELNFVKSKMMN